MDAPGPVSLAPGPSREILGNSSTRRGLQRADSSVFRFARWTTAAECFGPGITFPDTLIVLNRSLLKSSSHPSHPSSNSNAPGPRQKDEIRVSPMRRAQSAQRTGFPLMPNHRKEHQTEVCSVHENRPWSAATQQAAPYCRSFSTTSTVCMRSCLVTTATSPFRRCKALQQGQVHSAFRTQCQS